MNRIWKNLLVVLAVAAVPFAAAIAATNTYTNSTFGQVDNNDPNYEIRSFSVPTNAPVTDVNITVDFHPIDGSDCANPGPSSSFSGEVAFRLVSPGGTNVLLVSNDFNGGDTYEEANVPRVVVTFDDAAANAVGSTNAGLPEDGTFRPVEALSAFNGQSAAGTWEFWFQDDTGADALCFYSATLEISSQNLEIPTLSQWAMILLVLSVLGVTVVTMRRRMQ